MYKKWQAYTLVNLILKKISKIGATRCQILSLLFIYLFINHTVRKVNKK